MVLSSVTIRSCMYLEKVRRVLAFDQEVLNSISGHIVGIHLIPWFSSLLQQVFFCLLFFWSLTDLIWSDSLHLKNKIALVIGHISLWLLESRYKSNIEITSWIRLSHIGQCKRRKWWKIKSVNTFLFLKPPFKVNLMKYFFYVASQTTQ